MMSEKTGMITISVPPNVPEPAGCLLWAFASVVIGYVPRIRKRRTSLAIQWENGRSIEEAVLSDSSAVPMFGWA